LSKLKQKLLKFQKTLNYYETAALNQADGIQKHATSSYKAGDINYLEFVQLSTEAIQIRILYLESLNDYNQTVIQINRLLGNYRELTY
jgi:cobalt-zinc-cadmium resistance protein CzcA